ncbi:hypothetical protein MXAN_1315 [Myxococcus xanthus DK 1622]|uniref:Uncharacterized protein n=1 Tax=Myxococcus xanthus (strain DK1622) TaxID=246197 RepID=Q1DCQ1_MYXXD|nr:hypothetical protein MXAN_1315 [Myxococcus xanthus DK 1622]
MRQPAGAVGTGGRGAQVPPLPPDAGGAPGANAAGRRWWWCAGERLRPLTCESFPGRAGPVQ